MAADFSGLTSILQVWNHRVSSSMAFWRRGVIIRNYYRSGIGRCRRRRARVGRLFAGAECRSCTRSKAAGECGALRNSGSDQSLAEMLFHAGRRNLFVRPGAFLGFNSLMSFGPRLPRPTVDRLWEVTRTYGGLRFRRGLRVRDRGCGVERTLQFDTVGEILSFSWSSNARSLSGF
ncbi:hypothetical protein EVAR_102450_1 [Eumeta japonica]|uniref:Uncharacterized protein n=1 Tax=Eumeta variegata TaxID=151549 RepID=A0A4C1T8J5_EUMVA|nr:hypothetical protein EVAR_102450_1 [Eumeta japonica]